MPIQDLHEDRAVRASALRLGHIRLGIFNGRHPEQTQTFVFTSADRVRLVPIATELGGTIERYDPQGPEAREPWRVITEADAFTALFPFQWAEGDGEQAGNVDQSWELWAAGGPERFCTGRTCTVISYDDLSGERSETEVDCICRAQDERECSATTRIRLILPQTGLGIWELNTGSKIGAIELYDQARFIDQVTGGRMNRVPIRVTYQPRRVKFFDPKKRERISTTKRVVGLSIAGDAQHALAAVGVSEDRGLLEAVKLALGEGNGGTPALAAPNPAVAGGGAGVPPQTSEPAVEGTVTTGEPPHARPVDEPAPPRMKAAGSDSPASNDLWAEAKARGLKGATVLKALRASLEGTDQTPPAKVSEITDRQLRAVMESL